MKSFKEYLQVIQEMKDNKLIEDNSWGTLLHPETGGNFFGHKPIYIGKKNPYTIYNSIMKLKDNKEKMKNKILEFIQQREIHGNILKNNMRLGVGISDLQNGDDFDDFIKKL